MCHKSKVRMLNKKEKHLILFTELYREMLKKKLVHNESAHFILYKSLLLGGRENFIVETLHPKKFIQFHFMNQYKLK